MAELLFWSAAWKVTSADRAAAAVAEIERAVDDIDVDAAATVIFALSFWDQTLLPEQFETVRQSLIDRFRIEQLVFAIEDSAGAVAHYIVRLEESQNLHDETMRRLGLMRRLLPDQPGFGAQAYGHIFGTELFPHDPSTKKGVPTSSFPIPWVVRLAHLFSLIAGIQMRGASWGAYAYEILKLRRRLADMSSETSGALRKYFNKENPRNIFELGVEKKAWLDVSIALKNFPQLPASSVDAWGVEIEDLSKARDPFEPSDAHAEWTDALRQYAGAFHAFLEASTPYFLANCHVGRPTPGSADTVAKVLQGTHFKAHLATSHLADVIRSLPRLQQQYRRRFARFADRETLEKLESEEQSWIWTLWAVWFQFAEQPKQHFADARRESLEAVQAVRKKLLADLRQRLDSIRQAAVVIHRELGQWSDAKGLWLTMNIDSSSILDEALGATLTHVIEVLRPPADFHAFDWYVLDLIWRDVHIVPLVQGKSVGRKAWHFRIVALPQPGETIDAWRLLDLPLDDAVWSELKIDVWPPTIGGAPRRLQAALANMLALLNHLLRFDDAPKADHLGTAILGDHWNAVMRDVRLHASRAVAAAVECPISLFDDRDASWAVLRVYCEQIEKDVNTLEPSAFGALRDMTRRVNEFVTGPLTAIVHVAIDHDLSDRR